MSPEKERFLDPKVMDEELVGYLFSQISDGICLLDGLGNIMYMNPAAVQLLNIDPAETKSVTLCETLCGKLKGSGLGNCAANCPLRQPNPSQQSVTLEGYWEADSHAEPRALRVRCLKKPGVFPDLGRPQPDPALRRHEHLTLIEDVSIETQMRQQQEDWRNMVAHDLRAPLSTVQGTLSILRTIPSQQPMTQEEQSLIGMGIRACKRMLEWLDLYLEMAKLDAGAMPVRFSSVAVAKMLQRCLEEQEALSLAKRLVINVDVAPSFAVRADPDLLFRVFQNIFNNALKYTPPEGRITITAKRDEDRGVIFFRDSGPGIAVEDLNCIFDRFSQGRLRRAGRIQGTGLGLAFCREALKRMDGKIGVKSQSGHGSEFFVELPGFFDA